MTQTKNRPRRTSNELTAADISLSETVITVKVKDNLKLSVECDDRHAARRLSGRLRRFVKSHRVATEPNAVEAAVQTCIAIKVI